MNTFLHRLAARSLDALPTLRPRRASRFESSAAPGVAEEREEVISAPAMERSVTPSVPPEIHPVTAPSLAEVPPRNPHPQAMGFEPVRARKVESGPFAAGPMETDPVPGRTEPELRVVMKEKPLLVPGDSEIHLHPTQVHHETAEPSRIVTERRSREIRLQPLLVANTPLPDLGIVREPNRSADSGSAPRKPEDVHISIGRIEIRTPPSAPVTAPRRTPDASPSRLDTYLQQRGRRNL